MTDGRPGLLPGMDKSVLTRKLLRIHAPNHNI